MLKLCQGVLYCFRKTIVCLPCCFCQKYCLLPAHVFMSDLEGENLENSKLGCDIICGEDPMFINSRVPIQNGMYAGSFMYLYQISRL